MRDHDADTTDPRVASLLAAVAAPAEAPVPGEAAALAAFRAAMASPSHLPRRRMQTRTTAKLAAATALGAMTFLGGGYAVAATDTLPGAAAQAAFEAVGVAVRGTQEQAADAADASATRGRSAEAKAAADARKAPEAEPTEPESTTSGKGAAVSELATSTELTGVDKGAAVSDLASDGKSRAGQRDPEETSTPTGTEASTDGRARAEQARTDAATRKAGKPSGEASSANDRP